MSADPKGKAKDMGVGDMAPSRQNSTGMGVPADSAATSTDPSPSTPSGSEDESSPTRHHRHASASASSSHRHHDQPMPSSFPPTFKQHPLSLHVKLGPTSPFTSSPSSAGSLFGSPLGSPGYCQQVPPVIPQTHPLITRETLKELELEVTLRSPQLRHDLLFDPGLQFRPTSGRRKREQTERYWEAIAREMQYGCTCTCFDRDNRVYACVCGKVPTSSTSTAANAMFKPSVAPIATCWHAMVLETKSRILPLLQTLKEVLHLVIHPAVGGSATPSSGASSVSGSPPTSPTQSSYHTAPSSSSASSASDPLLAAFDPLLIQQEIQHGVFDYRSVFRWLGEIMKTHCAPMRDAMVETMVRMGTMEDVEDGVPRERRPVKALRMCFEILEVMKLDIANHQLQALRPYLLETCPDFELKTFQERFEKGISGLDITRRWISRAIAATPQPSPASRSKHVMTALCSAMVNVVFEPPAPDAPAVTGGPVPEKAYPETLYLDHARLNNYVNDAADLLGLYMLIMLFRQLTTSGAGSTAGLEDWEIDRIKREVWEVGPTRLGMCFDVLSPTAPPAESGSAHRDPKAKWEKGMMDVMLQIARRAEDARERIRSGKGRPADDAASSSTSTRMPSSEILSLIENWQKAHYKKGSPLQKIMKERLRAAVLDVVKENALAASASSVVMDGLTKPNVPSRHHSSSMSMRRIGRQPSIVIPSSNPSTPKKSAGTGLEPLMPEIQHLGERIARLVIFHSKVYGKLYEVDGFIDTKL
ncbi:hypothetical protein FRC04_001751 [Tulasnella sp. 424]|nr:hypothetical protein FRC04_001751 [Tulasnella sp. 424]